MATSTLQIGDIQISWLNGGTFRLDGGAMFGAVPKTLWSKLYPADKDNCIKLQSSPLLIKTPDTVIIVETGLGNKLTDKQNKIYKVEEPWNILDDLAANGLKRENVDVVILSHGDFDHAGGMVMRDKKGESQLTFSNAKHFMQRMEWEDVQAPNSRATNTYWPANFKELEASANLVLVDGNLEICPGVEVFHTGGHTRGHQMVRISSQDKTAYYLADLLATHIHFKPLWIMAYDNFPLEVIQLKEDLEKRIVAEGGWFLLYHDPFLQGCCFDDKGEVIDRWPPLATAQTKKIVQPKEKSIRPTKKSIQKIHVSKSKDGSLNQMNIGCPYCDTHRMIAVDKFMGAKHLLNVKCSCGAIFGVELNFRQHHRKEVKIGGYFALEGQGKMGRSDLGALPTTPINCEINNISRGGLGFKPLNPGKLKKGDKVTVSFTLDKNPPVVVEKEVVVKTVQDNFIGCEFTSASEFDRTLGFYLMK